MPFDAFLNEVDRLHSVSSSLEALADDHPDAREGILLIAGSVRNTATLLAILIATKLTGRDGHHEIKTKPI